MTLIWKIVTGTFYEEVPGALAKDEVQHLLFHDNVILSRCPEHTLSHQHSFIRSLSYTFLCWVICLKEYWIFNIQEYAIYLLFSYLPYSIICREPSCTAWCFQYKHFLCMGFEMDSHMCLNCYQEIFSTPDSDAWVIYRSPYWFCLLQFTV